MHQTLTISGQNRNQSIERLSLIEDFDDKYSEKCDDNKKIKERDEITIQVKFYRYLIYGLMFLPMLVMMVTIYVALIALMYMEFSHQSMVFLQSFQRMVL